MLVLNFGEFGWPEWIPPDPAVMQVMYQGAVDLCSGQHADPAIRQFIDRERARLQRQALRGRVTDTWIMNALLLIALQSQLDGKIPEHYYIDD